MIYLVDTSIWIELFRKRPLIQIHTEQLYQLCVCPPIIQELLQGFPRDLRYQTLKDSILALPCASPSISIDLYLRAAEIYRSGRKQGYTIRSSIDCLIAAIAIKNELPLWHKDRDYAVIAKYTDLQIVDSIN